jgi:hypothetical protein
MGLFLLHRFNSSLTLLKSKVRVIFNLHRIGSSAKDQLLHHQQGGESIHDFHGIDQYIDFNPRQRQSTRPVVM